MAALGSRLSAAPIDAILPWLSRRSNPPPRHAVNVEQHVDPRPTLREDPLALLQGLIA